MYLRAPFLQILETFFSDEQWLSWIDKLAEDDFVVIDDFISNEQLLQLRAFLLEKWQNDAFNHAKIGSNINDTLASDIRGDYTFWLNEKRDEQLNVFFNLIRESIANFNRYCFLSLAGFEFHLAHYPPNTFYKRHFDRFKDKSNRILSFVIYLNENWVEEQGGQLRMYNVNGHEHLDVEPIAKRVVIFKSDAVEHEVLPTTASRYSFTGWLLYQPSTVGSVIV